MRPYTVREQVAALLVELSRLRDALIRSTSDPVHAADLIRALRVLVLDGADALLLRLAGHFRVEHRVITSPPARPPASHKDRPEPGALVLEGMSGVVSPDHFARWRSLRGLKNPGKVAGLDLSFSEYLDLGVAADGSRTTPISRRELLADIANQAFGVHGSTAYPEHVELSWLRLESGPHYVALAQELGYEVLDYGGKVLEVAIDRMSLDLESLRAPGNLPVRLPRCPKCQNRLSLIEFVCPICSSELLAPLKNEPNIAELTNALRVALRKSTGALSVVLRVPPLLNPDAGTFVVASVDDGDRLSANLTRTANMTLRWSVRKNAVEHVAELNLQKRPLRLKPEDFFILHLVWTPERVVVALGSDPPDMEASSDGLPGFPDGDS